jgi:DNA ligase (NAD+)
MKIESLKEKIKEANKMYRTSEVNIMSDEQYDKELEKLKGMISVKEYKEFMNELYNDVIKDEKKDRKETLPYQMMSLDKVKTLEEIKKWLVNKKLMKEDLILTPKFDGLSILSDEKVQKAWTRGDGKIGQKSHKHIINMNYGEFGQFITCGEAIMKKSIFDKKYADKFANSRNLVAGQLNSDEPTDILKDIYYIRYGILDKKEANKLEQIKECNKLNSYKVPYETINIEDLTEEHLKYLYELWSEDFVIDGIVIDVNDYKVRENLKEDGENPDYAMAYKGNFEEIKQGKVLDVNINVSKQGLLKPVVSIEPIQLDGVTVSNVTAYNYKYLIDNGIGNGSIIEIKRSGQVIPKIISVIKSVKVSEPKTCPDCGKKLIWTKNNVDLMCKNEECESQRFQKIIAFFKIMGVEELGEGNLEIMYDAGYDTIKKILDMDKKDYMKLERFGERKAHIVYENIHNKMVDVDMATLMHSTGLFKGLGSTKLELVVNELKGNIDIIPSVETLCNISGFSEISAMAYINGIKKFKEFIKDLPITIKKINKNKEPEQMKKKGLKCSGMVFVFTGFRSDELEDKICDNGGEVGRGVNGKTTHLVMKEKGSGTVKEKMAIEKGITIWNINDLEKYLGNK